MYTITAEVINAFTMPASDKYPESYRLQLMGDLFTKDGQIRKDLIDFSVPKEEFDKLKDCVNQTVSLPVSFFVQSNRIKPYYPKGASPSREGSPRERSGDA